MLKKILVLGLFVFLGLQTFGQCFTYTIVACIDGRSLLHISGNQLWWEHLDYSPPGTHSSCPGPVTVNGTPWVPWNSTYTLPNTTTGCSLVANVIQCSYICNVIQAPSASNNWEAIYDFNDNSPSGAHMFTIELQYFCPSITVSPDASICPGEDAYLTASGGNTYAWSPATGLSCTNCPDPVASPASTTTYTVTGTDVNGCSASENVTVSILPEPSVSFSTSASCEGSATLFTDNTSGNPTFFTWDFGDGSPVDNNQNPSHTYASPGTYTVSLVASESGCFGTSTMDVTVDPVPVVDFEADNACLGTPVDFTDNSSISSGSISSWSWDFGDQMTSSQQNPSHTYLAAGDYTVSLTVSTANGCSDTYTDQITVFEAPTVDFTWNDACLSNGISFTGQAQVNGGTIAQWAWDYNEDQVPDDVIQSPTYNFPAAGTYNVGLGVMTDNGCVNGVIHQVTVYPEPEADFDLTDVCVGNNVQLTDQSSGGTIVQWDWDLGDGTTAQTQNVSYDYGGIAGSYNVDLTVTTDFGCTDNISQTVEVYDVPLADFAFQDVCSSNPADFTDASSVASGSIAQWAWDFGDGNTSNSQNPQNTYTIDGVYTVLLSVTTDNGCADDTTQDITIHPVPQATFSATTECLNDATQFTDQTVVSSGSISSWVWDFGDGGSDNTQNPSHTYTVDGTYTISLAISSNNGCTSSIDGQVTVHPLPEPDFTSTSVCFGNPTEFTDGSTISSGTIASYSWDFGDGATDNTVSPSHNYDLAGFYTVILTLTSDNSCTAFVEHDAEVYPLPVPAFSATEIEGCQPFTTNFMDESTIASGYQIVGWEWDMQTSTSNVQNPTGHYDQSGSYTVSLIVTSAEGCMDSITQTDYITVNPKPKAGFSFAPQPTSILYPLISFDDNSSNDVIEWQWDFGDGIDDTITNPSHEYPDTGAYTVTQVVYNQYGCGDTIEDIVIIDPAFTLYIPSAFTPGRNNLNDIFRPQGINYGIVAYSMRIFDRWGMQLFESYQLETGWDGTVRESVEKAPQGVYLYRIDVTNSIGEEILYSGRVTLIR